MTTLATGRARLVDAGVDVVTDAANGDHYFAAIRRDGVTTIYVAVIDDTGRHLATMTDGYGPANVRCPLTVLDAADPVDVAYAGYADGPDTMRAWATDWRLKVRAYHAARVPRATRKAAARYWSRVSTRRAA